MARTYSTSEVRTKFGEVMRRVRAGERVVVTSRGKEVAEIRPIEKRESLDQRVQRLEASGTVVPAGGKRGPWKAIAHHPGALERFLADRD
ncbi:MAG TPA: type II toxin-antitoxin system prevent-host-death family antitoxin [Vicinamibacteria bacterium]|nr:type II toxin-antitoxin system prevent-host-death family antitoxin [Vicinamibacteria bacterium]